MSKLKQSRSSFASWIAPCGRYTLALRFPTLTQTIPPEDAAPEWLHVKAMETHVQRTLRLMVEDNKEDFKADPMKALQSMAATIQMLQAQKEAPNIVDFKEALTTLWPYLQGKWLNKDTMVEFGWPYLDAMCGGLRPGDLISLVGRPAQGSFK